MSSAAHATTLRENCENAHYATGYTLLHEYNVAVEWAAISDDNHVKFENIIFGELFLVTGASHATDGSRTFYAIKEQGDGSAIDYEISLRDLQSIPGIRVSCRYDLGR